MIIEYVEFIEEMEWIIDVLKKKSKLPVVATMCIGKFGDEGGNSTRRRMYHRPSPRG